jgi:DUF4097 and DUF4098 domain-containing protein YvlB
MTMGEEHVSRILKMLEEGKISATEAQTLIAALHTESRAAGAEPAPGANAGARTPEPKPETPPGPDARSAKSFEFRWSQRRTFPGVDLSALGKQISDAVKKIDPERMLREARVGGKKWQERWKQWGRLWDEDEVAPQNTLGHPVARQTDVRTYDLPVDALVQVDNRYGAVTILGTTGQTATMEAAIEAWDVTEEEAAARLRDVKVESLLHKPEAFAPPPPMGDPPPMPPPPPPPPPGIGGARLEIHVEAPESWRDGLVNLVLRVPTGAAVRAATTFGEIRVEHIDGRVEVSNASGDVSLSGLGGEVRAEGVSGSIRAANLAGPVSLASKSGDLHAENLARGGSVVGISGDVRVTGAEGGRVEAKSVSGDVSVDNVGLKVPVDVTVESVSGDVKLVRAHGNIALKTVSGDAVAEHLDATTLQAQAVSGDLRLQLDAPLVGTLTTSTVSGDVNIDLPGTSNFRFTLTTQSGDLACAHAAHDGTRTDTLWSGTVGTGAGTVNVQTLSGDINLGQAD